jgi:DnaJ-class molecular chaperone
LTVPFTTAVTGGEARLKVKRSDGDVETITVKIPPGTKDGNKMRLRGQGEKPPRGRPGDILITVHVASHPCFQRRDNDLHVKVPVTLAEAAEGARIDVPTPGGTITLTVPPCTSSGRRLRVRGQGVPDRGGGSGDLYAEILIVLPSSLDEQSLEWIRTISKKNDVNPRSELKW